ncbi:MAG: AlwI family type II restriction endonuclease, partial [Paludibacteraceae bacterium]|nr:AlwI family type II restriction endonuclease [Paludibacteraceae bacterium]
MALEVAVRNPERYDEILRTYNKFKGTILDPNGIIEVFAQLYIDGAVKSADLNVSTKSRDEVKQFIKENVSHNNEWGFPTGWQAGFTRYLKTLSEFGFIYAQYNEPLRLSEVAEAVISNKITLSEAFAIQSMRFWRKSPYRRVLNDFNYFRFIVDAINERNESGHRLSYPQFMISLFSDDGDIESFINFINENKVGHSLNDTYALMVENYDRIDANHGKIAKQRSAFNDYGNAVFR